MEKIWLKSYAPGVPPTIDLQDITLQEALTRTAGRFPHRPALIFQGKTISFKELDEMVSRFASALKGLGVKPGDRVALLLPNLVQNVVGFYGALRLGAVAVPEQPSLHGPRTRTPVQRLGIPNAHLPGPPPSQDD